jgi:transposase
MNSQSSQQHQPQAPLEGELLSPSGKQITLSQQEYIQLKWDGNYWEAQHKRACDREAVLKQELKHEKAKVRDLNQRLFGKKTEKAPCNSEQSKDCPSDDTDDNSSDDKQPKRPRGHQKGQKGHGRTQRPNLPVVEETIELNECSCPHCGLDYTPFPGDETSEVFEVEVRAYKRIIKRKRAKTNCCCASKPGIICAPVAAKVIPRSQYGISIWVKILLGKYLYSHPIHRILQDMDSLGLPISQGTITGGLIKLNPLLEPVYKALYQKQMTETLFHNDESRWEVFEAVENKVGHRWYLWATQSTSVVYYCIDPTRSADVPQKHFAELCSDKVFVICDRYSAYKKLARLNPAIILAFCWVHVRRDFLELARSHPDLEAWGLDWVEDIGRLYHLNKQRLEQWEPNLSLAKQSAAFQICHQALEAALTDMMLLCKCLLEADEKAQAQPGKGPCKLDIAQRKVLTSLKAHWAGLLIFVAHPVVPMDNNTAERAVRGPVTGRKNYYGSGSIWSSKQAAMLFSIFQTMRLCHLNPRTWLYLYLESCANNGGEVPGDLSEFLPWEMSEARRQQLSRPHSPPTPWNTS